MLKKLDFKVFYSFEFALENLYGIVIGTLRI